ncbi:UMF1 family MFS transporter [Arcanobacterium pluranimalium]|uniref:MFS transporter n=1 Tax=Arcanobacterium pluranimalium TaxID=108028 RepID=UPI00195D11E2|nr:MFS transporter [Arcanobacterium pluranimalium]MBM7824592.1 UMF1 family MFS transporter [Arcanobacterium pluranimalium]
MTELNTAQPVLPQVDAIKDIASDSVNGDLGSANTKIFTKEVWAWGSWDWASAAFNAVVTTFVFSVYLTNAKLFGSSANTLLGYALSIAGIIIAIVAPALGQSVDRSGKSATMLRIATLSVVVIIAGLFFVSPNENRLWLGLFLLAAGNIAFETGSVIYNAMISDISTPKTVGRISGFGWGLGYVGGIVLLLTLFVGFISPEVGWFGVTKDNGLNIRVAMLIAAAWALIFSAPLLITAKDKPRREGTSSAGIIDAYKQLFASIRHLWAVDRSVVWFLISSAIYRDGLAGVFTFGAILASTAFGFSGGEVIIFGVISNVVAGIATIGFGFLDDKLGSRAVVIMSVASMTVFSLIVFLFHDGVGPLDAKGVFWVFGVGLCVFVGPTQSASRTYLARIAPKGEEGELFGLYATTGRAVSFLAPFMYSTAISIGAALTGLSLDDAAYFGILGIALVLLVGLLTFIPVKAQIKD